MLLCDWDECLRRIALATPETEPGREQLYHYLSYGWLSGGIIEVPLHKTLLFFFFIIPGTTPKEVKLLPRIDAPGAIHKFWIRTYDLNYLLNSSAYLVRDVVYQTSFTYLVITQLVLVNVP